MKYFAVDTGQFYDDLSTLVEVQSGEGTTFYVTQEYYNQKIIEQQKQKDLNKEGATG